MEEFEPFLADGAAKFQVNMLSLVPFAVFQVFSVLSFLFEKLGNILILSENNAKFIVPFVLNIFTENRIVLYIVNPLVAVILVNILLKFWRIEQIVCYGCGVGFVCNIVVYFILYIFSLVGKSFHFTICGSLPILIALAEAIVYASKDKRDVAIFTDRPCEFFWILMVFMLGTFTVGNLPALLSVFLSYWALVTLQPKLQFPENDAFAFTDFIPVKSQKKDDEEKAITSVIDSLGLTENQDLSEVDRNRRMRALRAIEERLESIQLPH